MLRPPRQTNQLPSRMGPLAAVRLGSRQGAQLARSLCCRPVHLSPPRSPSQVWQRPRRRTDRRSGGAAEDHRAAPAQDVWRRWRDRRRSNTRRRPRRSAAGAAGARRRRFGPLALLQTSTQLARCHRPCFRMHRFPPNNATSPTHPTQLQMRRRCARPSPLTCWTRVWAGPRPAWASRWLAWPPAAQRRGKPWQPAPPTATVVSPTCCRRQTGCSRGGTASHLMWQSTRWVLGGSSVVGYFVHVLRGLLRGRSALAPHTVELLLDMSRSSPTTLCRHQPCLQARCAAEQPAFFGPAASGGPARRFYPSVSVEFEIQPQQVGAGGPSSGRCCVLFKVCCCAAAAS